MSWIVRYDSHVDKYNERVTYYEETYDVKFGLTREEVEALTEEERAHYDEVDELIQNDKEFVKEYQMLNSLIYIIVVFGVLLGVMIPEFVIPLFFKNGQTLGKKAFGLIVIKPNGVRATNLQLLVRALLGKYTIEIMIPVLSFVTFLFGMAGNLGVLWLILAVLIILLNIGLVLFTKNHSMIHDAFSYTVVCNKETQMIFDSEDEMIRYKKEKHLLEVSDEREEKTIIDEKKSEV